MQVLSEGFTTQFEILKLSTIAHRKPGKMEGIEWGYGVSFRSSLVYQDTDEDLGLTTKEEVIEVKIDCDNADEVIQIKEFLQKRLTDGQPFYVKAGIPRRNSSKEPYAVKSIDNGAEFLKANNVKPTAKAS